MKRLGLPAPAAAVLAILAAGCDNTFTPIEPADQHLSVWGYLDASADTQWIRVGVSRPLLLTSPDSLPVRVILEETTSGRVIEMRQSTARFGGVGGVDSAGLYVHNFSTTERIEPGATYRIRAQPGSGEAAEAVVPIPPDYDVEVWLAQPWFHGSDLLYFSGLKHVAFVTATTTYSDSCGSNVEQKTFSIDYDDTASTVRSIPISRLIQGRGGVCGTPVVARQVLWAAGSGARWPAGLAYSAARLGGTGPSNVTNGIGFVGGILTRTLPYESCTYATYTNSNYCRLHYDSTSATLSGTVQDPACGFNVPRAQVQLREIDAPETPKIRSTITDTDGTFRIGALLPGIRYALAAGRDESPDVLTPEYAVYRDTLQFTPGQQATLSLSLRRQYFPCPSQP